MYLYGGKVSIFENSNCVYAYDFLTNDWEILNSPVPQLIDSYEFPLYIDSHNSEIYDTETAKEMVIFGGFIGGNIAKYSRSVFSYDFAKNQWKSYFLQKKAKKTLIKTASCLQPKKRANAGMGIYHQFLYIFGGTNGKRKFKDMWKYDLSGQKWSEILSSDIFPDVYISLKISRFLSLKISCFLHVFYPFFTINFIGQKWTLHADISG